MTFDFEMVRLVQTKECGNESIDKTKLFNIVILDSTSFKIRLYDWPSLGPICFLLMGLMCFNNNKCLKY